MFFLCPSLIELAQERDSGVKNNECEA
jgi:hypothetical protein